MCSEELHLARDRNEAVVDEQTRAGLLGTVLDEYESDGEFA